MKILQQPIKVKRHSRVNVHFSRPCTVFLMTELNFKRYKDGASFKRLGGAYEKSPVEFTAPYDGTWHAIIEKGSHINPAPIEGRVEVLPPLMKELPYLSDADDIKMHETTSEPKKEIIDSEEAISTTEEEITDSTKDIEEEHNETNEEEEDNVKD